MAVEVRYDDGRKVDEIVGTGCSVHLERLTADTWSLVLETDRGRGAFTIHRAGKAVEVKVYEVDMRMRSGKTQGENP